MKRGFRAVVVANEIFDSLFVIKSLFLTRALVGDENLELRVQKREFSTTLRNNVITEVNNLEDFRVRLETNEGAAFVGFTEYSDGTRGETAASPSWGPVYR